MPSDLDVIRAILGATDISLPERQAALEVGHITCYTVFLPQPKFRGFPPKWIFGILTNATADVLVQVTQFVKQFHKDTPVLLCPNHPGTNLSDIVAFQDRSVFSTNYQELQFQHQASLARLTPILKAVRRKLRMPEALRFVLEPYRRGKPTSGWRFFGRKKEVEQLINTEENFFVLGARRIGKTSILQEARQRLESRGDSVFYVDVQNFSTLPQVVDAIVRAMSPRDAATAMRRSQILGEPLLEAILKRITAGSQRVVLILDEIGNVIKNSATQEWRIVGVLRKFSQLGSLRVIMSCLTEVFERQAAEFGGPFVNFATVMRLRAFSDSEVEEMVLGPLELWRPINDRSAVLRLVLSVVGRQPIFLQFFCHAVFERVLTNQDHDLLLVVETVLRKELTSCFSEPIEEVFFRTSPLIVRYLFLKRCKQAEERGESILGAIMDDDWVLEELSTLGYTSTMDSRREIFETMEMRGLTMSVREARTVQAIASPIIYQFIRLTERNLEKLMGRHIEELRQSANVWNLQFNA